MTTPDNHPSHATRIAVLEHRASELEKALESKIRQLSESLEKRVTKLENGFVWFLCTIASGFVAVIFSMFNIVPPA